MKRLFHQTGDTAIKSPEVALQWHQALRRLEGAYSPNTIRAYRADFEIFETWCRSQQLPFLPASEHTVADFVQMQSGNSAPATVERRCAAIAKIHRLLGQNDPTLSEEKLLALRSVYRKHGRRQEQVLGINEALRNRMIAACDSSLIGLRDRVIVAVGYDTLCRRAELTQLSVHDIHIKTDGSATVIVRRAKNDQKGDGRVAFISHEAIFHLNKWLLAAQVDDGPVFRSVNGGTVGKAALHPYGVARTLKKLARASGISPDLASKISGHSLRVGAAQDMAAAGISLISIMQSGGWKSPNVVMRYVEHLNAEHSGMARLHRLAGDKSQFAIKQLDGQC